jgi:type IV pilus assembly protein PilA
MLDTDGEGALPSSPFFSVKQEMISMKNLPSTKSADQIQRAARRGFSLIELLIVVSIILIIAAIAIPNLLRSRMAANQATAVANLRTIISASVSYSVIYANGYPPSLDAIGGVEGAPATCNAAILIDQILSTAPYQKTGYQFALTGNQGAVANPPGGCAPGNVGYMVSAAPLSISLTGNMGYCSNESGVLHYDTAGAAAATSIACDALPTIQ